MPYFIPTKGSQASGQVQEDGGSSSGPSLFAPHESTDINGAATEEPLLSPR